MSHFALITLMNFGAVGVAANGPIEWAPPIYASAIIATVLGWFMFRLEKKLEHNSNRLEHVARSSYYQVLASRAADTMMKQDAQKDLDDLNEKKEL